MSALPPLLPTVRPTIQELKTCSSEYVAKTKYQAIPPEAMITIIHNQIRLILINLASNDSTEADLEDIHSFFLDAFKIASAEKVKDIGQEILTKISPENLAKLKAKDTLNIF